VSIFNAINRRKILTNVGKHRIVASDPVLFKKGLEHLVCALAHPEHVIASLPQPARVVCQRL
jgi:hypothetical protein